MILRFADHSANERTYLAWVRTAITIMAFGFLIEKFDLFLNYISEALGRDISQADSGSAELVGVGLIVVAIAIIISSTIRFYINKSRIESDEERIYRDRKAALMLGLMIVLIAVFLVIYVGHQILGF